MAARLTCVTNTHRLLPLSSFMQVAIRRHPLEGGLTAWTALAVAYLTLFVAYWLVALVRGAVCLPPSACCGRSVSTAPQSRGCASSTAWRAYMPLMFCLPDNTAHPRRCI